MKDDSSLNSFVKPMWELHGVEMLRGTLVPLMATLLGPQANVAPEFQLLGALDTPAGRPYTRLFEIVRAPRAVP